jgi:hypothetical protein
MLLIGMCQSLLRLPDPSVISSELLSVQDNCTLLLHASETSKSALSFLRLLEPLYLRVKELTDEVLGNTPHRTQLTVQVGSTATSNDKHVFDPSVIVVLIGQLVEALQIQDIIGCE